MRLVFDIEANGLYDDADTIWCICAEDVDTGEKWEYGGDGFSLHSLPLLSKATELIGHNIINYDLPLLKKILGWAPNETTKITDTLVMSRLANPDRPKPPGYTGKGGPHSLEAWGYRVGKGKPEHDEWNVFSPAMLRRCREDVGINVLAYHTISSGELNEFSEVCIDLEHSVAACITRQEHYGIRFDKERAEEYVSDLTGRIDQIDRDIVPKLPKSLEVLGTTVTNPFLKTGGYRKQTKDYLEQAYNKCPHEFRLSNLDTLIGGPYTRIKFNTFDLGSTQKVKEFLLSSGWLPENWNYSKTTGERTSPKLEGDFHGVDGEIPKAVKERITWRHRRSQIEGWISNVRSDNTLPAGANPCGTNTGRMRHRIVVNIPKANTDKEGALIWDTEQQKDTYGTQMRSLFIPREGYVLVGHDASGLELRMLAHYMNDPEFTKEILDGDIHTFNQLRAGLPTRDSAKTFIYALIYGAGDAKIGSVVGGDASDGKQLKSEYFGALPRLAKFIDSVKRASGKGWLKGLDGRRVYMRRDASGRIARSKAPNTLLQNAGAVVMKKSCVILWDEVNRAQIKAQKVLDMHDEGQSEVWNDSKHIEPYCEIAVNSITQAGEYFNMNIPLAAECKIGMNLAETH